MNYNTSKPLFRFFGTERVNVCSIKEAWERKREFFPNWVSFTPNFENPQD